MVVRLGTHLAGHGGDGWQNLWNLWWVGRSLTEGHSPFHSMLLHHPHGAPLWLHTLAPLHGLLGLPLSAAFGQPAAYNLLFLFDFTASGFCLYLLARELGATRLAAFLAGAVFTFSHYHFAHAQGHLNLVAMQWAPLFLLCLVRAFRRARARDGVLLGVALSLAVWSDLYHGLYCGLLGLLAAGWALAWRRREALRSALARALGLGGLTFALLGGPLILGVLLSWTSTEYVQAHDPRTWSADLQGFFVPGWISAWSGPFAGLQRAWTGNPAENCWYLGYSVLGAGALAFLLRPRGRRPWAWAGLMLLGMLLALGPALHWGGRIFDVPLPYRALETLLPPVRMSGAPTRFHFLALLAGLGASALQARLADRRWLGRPAGALAVLGLLGLQLLELLPRPVEATLAWKPGFAALLAAGRPDEAILQLGDCNLALFHQTLHARPLVGGCLARNTVANERFVRDAPLLRALRGELRLPPDRVLGLARELRLRHVVVPAGHPVLAWLPELGLHPRGGEAGWTVWEIPWRRVD
jgi:hypothetical protein